MNNHKNEELEFNILGFKVRFSAGGPQDVDPNRVVEYVQGIADQLKQQAPHVESGKVALLAALKIAAEKLILEDEYKDYVNKSQISALDTLHLIEEVSPTTF